MCCHTSKKQNGCQSQRGYPLMKLINLLYITYATQNWKFCEVRQSAAACEPHTVMHCHHLCSSQHLLRSTDVTLLQPHQLKTQLSNVLPIVFTGTFIWSVFKRNLHIFTFALDNLKADPSNSVTISWNKPAKA